MDARGRLLFIALINFSADGDRCTEKKEEEDDFFFEDTSLFALLVLL